MRVLHIAPGAADGGSEIAIRNIIRACSPLGVEAVVACPAGPFDFGVEKIELPRLARSIARAPKVIAALSRAARRTKPDIIHFHSIGYFLVFGLMPRLRPKPCVLSLHGGISEAELRKVTLPIRLLSRCTIAYGPGTARFLSQLSVKNEMIFYGFEPPPAPADRNTLASLAGVAPETQLLLAVGRLVHQKNHKVLVRTLPLLPQVHLIIAGEGPLRGPLENLANELHVSDRLHLLGFRSDARALMAAADIVLMPSFHEGFGLVAAEAMLAHRPLIAANTAGLREWVTHEDRGLLVPPEDPAAIALAISRVFDDRSLRERIQKNGYDFAKELTIDKFGKRHMDIYASLVRPNSRVRSAEILAATEAQDARKI